MKKLLIIGLLSCLALTGCSKCEPAKEKDTADFIVFDSIGNDGYLTYNGNYKKYISNDFTADGMKELVECGPEKGDTLILHATGPHNKDKYFKVEKVKKED